jgi:hypothetical protein
VQPLPPTYDDTRAALQRVAVHVLARRRTALVGKFGLRALPDGIGIPASGPDHEVLRTSGSLLLREVTGATASTTSIDLATASLGQVARFAQVDLTTPLDVGHDTPPVGDVDVPLGIDDAAARTLGRWLAFGWSVLDVVVAGLGPAAAPNVVQLWPEHFDAGCDVATGPSRASLGASTGDHHEPTPYLYLSPWAGVPDGDRDFWNAEFGAVLPYEAVRAAADPAAAATAFLRRGLDLLPEAPGGHPA